MIVGQASCLPFQTAGWKPAPRGSIGMEKDSGMRLKDQVALVTGGGRGIGRGIVRAFVAEGAKVAFVYLGNQAAAELLVQEVTQAGGTIKALKADVTKIEDAQRCFEDVQKTWGKLDILVNNAGIIRDDLFVRLEPEEWNRVLQTNLGGTYNFCKAAAFSMMRHARAGSSIYRAWPRSTRIRARRTMRPAREPLTRSRGPWPWSWAAATSR